MKYKLVDIIEETEHGVAFGTCELCFHTGSLTATMLVLEDENDTVHHLEMGDWSWGDYIDNSYILEGVDIFELAEFISSQDIIVGDKERMTGDNDMFNLRNRIIHWIWDREDE